MSRSHGRHCTYFSIQQFNPFVLRQAEHFAERHGHEAPPWTNERERFLDKPWHAKTKFHYRRWEAALYCPGAFTRHGTPIHPSDLDSRGGDEPWKPDCCEATTFLEDSEIFRS